MDNGSEISRVATTFLTLYWCCLIGLNHQQFCRAVHINAEIISPGAGFKTQEQVPL